MNKMTMQEMIDDLLDKVRCPQTGSTTYGEWGALRLDLRLYLYEFAKRCQYYADLDKDLDKFMVDTCLRRRGGMTDREKTQQMDYYKALQFAQSNQYHADVIYALEDLVDLLDWYPKLDELVERGTPTKVLNKKKDIQFDTYSGTCPNCGWKLHNSVLERYCCSCGQNIDWRMTFER